MPVPRVKVQPLPHAVFLSRLASATDSNAIEVRLGQAAFLTLRLVDLLSRDRSEEHTSELQSQSNIVCRLLLEKKKNISHSLYPHMARHSHIAFDSRRL